MEVPWSLLGLQWSLFSPPCFSVLNLKLDKVCMDTAIAGEKILWQETSSACPSLTPWSGYWETELLARRSRNAMKNPDKNMTVAPIHVNISGISAKNHAPIIAVQISFRKSKGMVAVGSVSLRDWLIAICAIVPDKPINASQPSVWIPNGCQTHIAGKSEKSPKKIPM